MQYNKSGNPVNQPQYVISGEARRKMKKELANLKYEVKMAPFYRDLHEVHGTANPIEDHELSIKQAENRIEILSKELNKKIND